MNYKNHLIANMKVAIRCFVLLLRQIKLAIMI